MKYQNKKKTKETKQIAVDAIQCKQDCIVKDVTGSFGAKKGDWIITTKQGKTVLSDKDFQEKYEKIEKKKTK